jgi:hypothetical protein
MPVFAWGSVLNSVNAPAAGNAYTSTGPARYGNQDLQECTTGVTRGLSVAIIFPW